MKLEHLSVRPKAIAKDDNSHIEQLLVAGPGHEAVEALQSVRHRVNKDTAVCLMTDGLGVLEEVRQRVFQGTESRPSFVLGHMSHRLAFNRRYDAVKELRHGKTQLTFADSSLQGQDVERTESRINFVQAMEGVKDLNSSLAPFDKWLHFKLPSVILDSVVEPVCVLMEIPYAGLQRNPAAQRMMQRLLTEIITVVDNMPEIEGSAAIRNFIRGSRIKQHIYSRIMARRGASSDLARQIQNGLPTDIDYLNGFFIRRGHQLGIETPTNSMIRDMIKAKHSLAIERLNSYIPIRKARLEQLKTQGGGASRGNGGPSGQDGERQRQQADEARQQILNQILHPEAADRLGRIRLVKEQRATDIENRLITLAQTGQLRQKVTEAQLKDLLTAVADNQEQEKIVVSRRKGWDDDDDLDDL
ncbi:hypothetical protein BBK36DRAFT_1107649 [Trichoderma citrinoviride]|uniref:2-dehydropantoate 2-reductase n=1 Tax=Trichoderma citrinoviride TaxID=58853 RepID=A0A2T4BMC2_9HYPO|nr:hypothetical protein BBK36DRAFT_1107649 [Trichoderma citrinoviride]PTB70457.1 hypothetical protein BBK36DRAFT_1107649 [Trichoderma citrinoviride]